MPVLSDGSAYYEAMQLSLKKDKKELEELWQMYERKCKHYKVYEI